jgi:hypothetical protein
MNQHSKKYRQNEFKIRRIEATSARLKGIIELGIDTMVMDNDDASCRHGVKPTYTKKKGFQPLQMNWGNFIVDAVFRGGGQAFQSRRQRAEYDSAHGH